MQGRQNDWQAGIVCQQNADSESSFVVDSIFDNCLTCVSRRNSTRYSNMPFTISCLIYCKKIGARRRRRRLIFRALNDTPSEGRSNDCQRKVSFLLERNNIENCQIWSASATRLGDFFKFWVKFLLQKQPKYIVTFGLFRKTSHFG